MTRPAPKTRAEQAPLVDMSPSYNSGSTDLADTFADVVEKDVAKEKRVQEATWPMEEQAYAARKAGQRERAAQLFDQIAVVWRNFGFKYKAETFAAFAADQRTPPKTIGRRPRRSR